MLTDPLRRLLRGWLEAIAGFFHRLGISANALTVFGASLHLVVLYFLAEGDFLTGALVMLVASGLDGIDGTLARISGQAGRIGAFLDSTLDRVAEIIVFLGLLLFAERSLAAGEIPDFPAWLVYLALTGSVMVSYTRARSEGVGLPTRSGIFTRFERVLVLWLGLVLGQVNWALWILAVGAWFTALQRVLEVLRLGRLEADSESSIGPLDAALPSDPDAGIGLRATESIERGSEA